MADLVGQKIVIVMFIIHMNIKMKKISIILARTKMIKNNNVI